MQQLHPLSSGCLTHLELDELLAGELSPSEQQRCEVHLAECSACRARKLALEQSKSTPQAAAAPSANAEAPPAGVMGAMGATQAARARSSWRWLSLPLTAACAAVSFIALRPAVRPPPANDSTHTGQPQLEFFVKRGDNVTRGERGTPVFPGDALRFVYSIDRPSYLAIYSADARGVSVYFPNSQLAHQLTVGQDVALDFSVELDETVGRERLIGLFCPEAFAVERVQGALTSSSSLPDALAGCQRVELQLNKKARL